MRVDWKLIHRLHQIKKKQKEQRIKHFLSTRTLQFSENFEHSWQMTNLGPCDYWLEYFNDELEDSLTELDDIRPANKSS